MSKSTLKILPALMIAITAAFVTQPVRASVINNIVITEKSSTNLAVTYTLADGTIVAVTVTSGTLGADDWRLTFPFSVSFINTNTTNWIEPENSGEVNAFNGLGSFGFVLSEATTGNPKVADGTTVDNVGTDSVNGGSISVTFFDKGDVAAAPDTGTTFSIFGLSLMGLGFLRRKLC